MTTVGWMYLPLQAPKNITHDEAIVIISKAAGMWNSAMQNLVSFEHGTSDLQVRLFFGSSINQKLHPSRIAECRDKGGCWEIEFDIRSKWNKGEWWNRLLGNSNALLCAALHEFGHVMDLPHAMDYNYIMHPEIPTVKKLSAFEIIKYRNYFIQREKSYE